MLDDALNYLRVDMHPNQEILLPYNPAHLMKKRRPWRPHRINIVMDITTLFPGRSVVTGYFQRPSVRVYVLSRAVLVKKTLSFIYLPFAVHVFAHPPEISQISMAVRRYSIIGIRCRNAAEVNTQGLQ